MRAWLKTWQKVWLPILLIMVGGCVIAGVKTLMPVEKARAQDMRERGIEIQQHAQAIKNQLPPDMSGDVYERLSIIEEEGGEVEANAIKSEKWHTAGEKAVGAPKEEVKPNTDEETAALTDFEKKAATVGKVRNALSAGKALVGGGTATASGGNGGLIGLLGGGGTATGVGGLLFMLLRKKLKQAEDNRQAERKADEERRLEEQRKRDKEQDDKLNSMMGMMATEIEGLKAQIAQMSKPPAPTPPAG